MVENSPFKKKKKKYQRYQERLEMVDHYTRHYPGYSDRKNEIARVQCTMYNVGIYNVVGVC